ncbi:MAG TPA: CoA transferase, partial [Bacteroidia bacterium]|nr:CoA transferase [Bacteroidia bacterium]
NDKQFSILCHQLGADSLGEDKLFSANISRVKHRKLLFRKLSLKICALDSRSFARKLDGSGVPFAFIRSLPEALSDPRMAHLTLNSGAEKVLKSVIFKG